MELGDLIVASMYVPNGGKDYPAKLDFLTRLVEWVRELRSEGRELLLCGDVNIARTEMDVHPRERKPMAIGQRPEERALFETLLGAGLIDVGRAMDPDNPGLFTWWAPWRNLRARNIGWRLDYLLASPACGRSRRELRGAGRRRHQRPRAGGDDDRLNPMNWSDSRLRAKLDTRPSPASPAVSASSRCTLSLKEVRRWRVLVQHHPSRVPPPSPACSAW